MMSLILCLCVLAADTTSPTPKSTDANEPRRITTIRREMSAAMQQEAGAATDAARADAIYQMTELYKELKGDPRLPLSDTLQAYKAELWSRLTRVQTRLERRFAREAKKANKHPAPNTQGQLGSPATHDASRAFAEHMDLFGRTMGGPIILLSQNHYNNDTSRSHADALYTGKPASRTAAAPRSPGRGGGAVRPDFGPALVELIERTISPDSWDVNGGPGTIVYYPAFHCLVVRASGEVHEAIGGVLGGLAK